VKGVLEPLMRTVYQKKLWLKNVGGLKQQSFSSMFVCTNN
jgi:hypothetical protein